MAKVVLVSYLDRNKVLRIPHDKPSHRTDLEFLEDSFRSSFSFQKNVKLCVTFQRYDNDWGEYVDMEPFELVENREKLKAVVSPLLEDPSTNSSLSVVSPLTPSSDQASSSRDTDSTSNSTHVSLQGDLTIDCSVENGKQTPLSSCKHKSSRSKSILDDFEDNEEISRGIKKKCRKLVLGDSDDSSIEEIEKSEENNDSMPVVKIEPSVAKFKVQKDKDVLLPDPFPLPKRVTPRVDAAVSSGEVDRLARNSLLSSVAHSIYQIKAYPSEADFINVSKEIMKNYPTFFLSQGALIELLKERMKQIRRPPILRTPKEKGSTSSKALKGGRSPGSIDSLKAPPVPLGEDEHSFERHNRVLKSQYSKSHPNQQIVTELMRITFAMRRADILNCPCDVKTIFEKYPFLQTEHLINDFTLLVGSSIHLEKDITIEDYFASSFSSFIPKIFSLAAIESKGRKLFNSVYHDLCQKDTSVESKLLIALYFLVYLLPDAQAKVNPSLLLLFSEGALDVEKVAADSRNKHPFIIILGSMNKPEQFFLIVDKVVVREVEATSILINLLSAYYVYNVCYPRGLINFFTFLEIMLLKIKPKKVAPCVSLIVGHFDAK